MAMGNFDEKIKSRQSKRDANNFLGYCLRNARKKRGITQKELASIIGISQSSYASYENGVRRCPAIVLIKISKALQMPVELIIGETNEFKRNQKYKDLEEIAYNVPIDDLDAFIKALEIELAQSEDWLEEDRDTPAIKWAGKGLDVAQKVNKRGQDMIEQFIASIMDNPIMLKSASIER